MKKIIRKSSVLFLMAAILTISACGNSKPSTDSNKQPKNRNINSKDLSKVFATCNMPGYQAEYKLTANYSSIDGGLFQSLTFSKNNYAYKSQASITADLAIYSYKSIKNIDSKGVVNGHNIQSIDYFAHDITKGKYKQLNIFPGNTDGQTLLLKVRNAFIMGQKQLTMRLQSGNNKNDYRKETLALTNFKQVPISIPLLSSKPINTYKFDYTNSKGRVIHYYLAKKYGYMPVLIRTSVKKFLTLDLQMKLVNLKIIPGPCLFPNKA